MKKIIMAVAMVLCTVVLFAQEQKNLTLSQTAAVALEQNVITPEQKVAIDKLIKDLDTERKALHTKMNKEGKTPENIAASKKLSSDFNAQLRKALGSAETLAKWQAIRYHK